MTTTEPWLGINPAECLKDSDTRQMPAFVNAAVMPTP